jgi:hypothetical protein
LEGLYLTAFNYQKVYTNKKVKEYYKENVYLMKPADNAMGSGVGVGVGVGV